MLRPVLVLAATAALAAGVVVAALAVTRDDPDPPTRTSPAADETLTVEGQFSLRYPPTWRRLRTPAGFVASLRREAGDGQMDITRTDRRRRSLRAIEDELTTRLKRQLPDFRLVRATTPEIAGERSLSYTFERTKTGQAQNLTIIPAGTRTYTLSSVLGRGGDQAAAEVAAIARSFRPQ